MPNSEIKIYQLENGNTEVQVKFTDETVWLNLNQMAKLFDRNKSVISRHIRNIFKENELIKDSVVAKNATTAKQKRYKIFKSRRNDIIYSLLEK